MKRAVDPQHFLVPISEVLRRMLSETFDDLTGGASVPRPRFSLGAIEFLNMNTLSSQVSPLFYFIFSFIFILIICPF